MNLMNLMNQMNNKHLQKAFSILKKSALSTSSKLSERPTAKTIDGWIFEGQL